MTAIGLGGFVTGRGWLESGNPASIKISLKLFNIKSCTDRAFASRASAATNELSEVALEILLALEGFLVQMDFCKAELAMIIQQPFS